MAKKWTDKNAKAEIRLASVEALEAILSEKQCLCFVWPEEGTYTEGTFTFNEDYAKHKPLLVDLFTASALMAVINSLNEEQRDKVIPLITTNRLKFIKFVGIAFRNV